MTRSAAVSSRLIASSAVMIVGCSMALLPASTATAAGHVGKTWAEATMRSGAAHPSTDLGYPVAISGDTMVVGAAATVTGQGGGQGAVYVYTKAKSGVWADATPKAVLTVAGSPPTDEGEGLGTGVAIEGNTIVAGNSAAGKDQAGAVYIFNKPRHGWRTTSHPSAVLTPSAASDTTSLGGSVAIYRDTIVASAFSNNYPSAAVFTRPASGWAHEHETADLVNTTAEGSDALLPVAVSANTVVVGGHYDAGAWLFSKPPTGWATTTTPTQELTESNVGGSAPDSFGYAVAVEGSTVAVGAPGDLFFGQPPTKGAVYLYAEPPAGWGSVASPMSDSLKLQSVHEPKGDFFGSSVAFSGPRLAVGAPTHVVGHHDSAGVGYVFDTVDSWTHGRQVAALPDPNGGPYDELGWSTAISGSSVVFGAEYAYKSEGAADVYTAMAKPTLAKLSQTHHSWTLGDRKPSVNPKHAPKGGDRLTFRLNEPATVTLTFTSVGVKPLRLRVAGKAGVNKVYVDGPITKHLGLQAGHYTVTARAENAATAKSSSKQLHFIALA
jgi:FG-GAP repeat